MQDKVVIITGGSSGIGQACAEVFGQAGAKIVITGRKKENLEETSRELKAAGIDNLALVADSSIEADNKMMVERTLEKYDKIDVLIANAGISMRALFEELDLEVFKKIMDINLYGTLYATKYCLPHIFKTKGSIIGISSITGHLGIPSRTAYSASKHAMNGLLEALRTEVMTRGVHVLVVAPGFTQSNIRKVSLNADGQVHGESPMDENKMMTSEAVAKAILKATKGRKRDLVLTVEGKLAVFLNKWIPGFVDKMVYKKFANEKGSVLK
ncbi:MAG: SDR family oxidoreductase [Bacteroidetes bacterium]|nr:SDR family oxidoreductase [Bacteroidota bacterium]